ncbi:MAG TPA: pyruvate dehydrogenase (acetyl-transferring) E1 component subunit alpha [Steroidobacteraceae bacterium]|jgi:2-oxoisovalerate dehydrogenase E1 component alpha subunit|nr:pyruvate dehydrogenase (acetyl-transferring) E1 component subunit alpha [Steroidobacteraceae bacterium]
MAEPQVVARFEIPFRACLGADGAPCGELPGFVKDAELLGRMYDMMVRARAFDTKAINLQRTGKLGTYPSCLGHEATQIGIGAAMHADDVLFTVYREIGIKFWRGVEMLDILLYWGGDERGTRYRHTPQDFPFCVPIGSQMPHAAGAAWAMQIKGEARCALACIGDGGTSQGAFYEAINLAGAKSLPLVCVIVNNGWAISVPVAAQTAARTLAQKAVAAGVPATQVDGNDALIVREVVGEAVERARSGGGPSVIEALTYRLSDHTTSDDATRYRSNEEVEAARKRDPIARLRAFLQSRGLWDEAAEQLLRRRCSEQIEAAVSQYLATPRQSTDSMFDHVYAELPEALRTQREQARRYAAAGH